MRAIQMVTTGFVALAMAACGGGGGGSGSTLTPTFTVGGSVSNLKTGMSLVLQLNGGDDTPVTSNTTFTFSTPVASGSNYAVTVKSEPVSLACPVANSSGSMGGANITNVAVTCGIAKYNVSGTVNGMPYGQSMTLLDNGTDTLARTSTGRPVFQP